MASGCFRPARWRSPGVGFVSQPRAACRERPQGGGWRSLQFAPDGQMIISGGSDSTVRLSDLAGQSDRTLLDDSQAQDPAWFAAQPELIGGGKSNLLMSAVMARDKSVLAADYGGRVWLMATNSSSDAIELEEAGGPIWSLDVSPDGNHRRRRLPLKHGGPVGRGEAEEASHTQRTFRSSLDCRLRSGWTDHRVRG